MPFLEIKRDLIKEGLITEDFFLKSNKTLADVKQALKARLCKKLKSLIKSRKKWEKEVKY